MLGRCSSQTAERSAERPATRFQGRQLQLRVCLADLWLTGALVESPSRKPWTQSLVGDPMPQLSFADCEALLRVLEACSHPDADLQNVADRLRGHVEQAVASTVSGDATRERDQSPSHRLARSGHAPCTCVLPADPRGHPVNLRKIGPVSGCISSSKRCSRAAHFVTWCRSSQRPVSVCARAPAESRLRHLAPGPTCSETSSPVRQLKKSSSAFPPTCTREMD